MLFQKNDIIEKRRFIEGEDTMKKKAYLFIIIAMILLSGCDKQSTTNKAPSFDEPLYEWGKVAQETITIWGVEPDMDRSYIQKACKRYETLTDNQIKIVQIPKDQIVEKMTAALQGEIEAPDIFVNYGGTNIDAYDPDENFYDFSDAVWVQDLTETSINQTVYHGKIIGLPHWEASISGTIYNKEIFDKYHLSIPTTQQEFLNVCEELLRQGITPMYMPAKEISMLLYQFPLDTVVENPAILEQLNQGELGYQDLPEMKTILTWYRTMAEKGYFGEHYMEDRWNGMSDALESEQYAMLLCWDTWLYTDFKGDASKFALMPAFMGVPDQGTFEGPNLNLFMANKHSEKLDAALDFITFLADPYNYNVAFENINTAPVFKKQIDSISTPQYLENERLIEKNYHDSIAWLRIKGYSQMDASSIYEYIRPGSTMSESECLKQMDELRNARIKD